MRMAERMRIELTGEFIAITANARRNKKNALLHANRHRSRTNYTNEWYTAASKEKLLDKTQILILLRFWTLDDAKKF